jgi:UDP-N-acetylglucosamine pyrophosphorylase
MLAEFLIVTIFQQGILMLLSEAPIHMFNEDDAKEALPCGKGD